MARTKGGKKRVYKVKGRLSPQKAYQQYCREQYRNGMLPTSTGKWTSGDSHLSTKIAEVYQKGVLSRLR